MNLKLFFFVLLILSTLPLANALRVNGRVIINFEPGKVYEGNVCVIPEGVQAVELKANPVGGAEIILDKDTLDLTEGPACTKYTVKLPERFEKPGMQRMSIAVTQKVPESEETIIARVRVIHQVWVDVPYPGKYLEASLAARNADAGGVVYFKAEVTSKGKETINFAKGKVYIYNWDDELVGEEETNTVTSLKTQQSATLTAKWNSTTNTVGDYHALLVVTYDGLKTNATAKFKLGSLEVRMVDYTKKVFKKGIVPFSVVAESYWSQPVKGVKAVVEVLNASNHKVAEFETLSKDFKPWQRLPLEGYLDTTNIPVGNYSLKITLFYEEESKEYQGSLEVTEEAVIEEGGSVKDYINAYLNSPKALLLTAAALALIATILIIKLLLVTKKVRNT